MTDSTPLDELQWKSPEWIQAFGLRTDNVLEYFSQSPFFDRTSNNQVVKMQSQFNENIQLHSLNIEFELKKMKGIEFVILHRREPDFWIIRKQYRTGPEQVESLSDYYIIGANVYMAPTVKDVVSTRLLSSALSLKNSLDKLQSLAQFTPSDGHTYRLEASETQPPSRSRTLGNTPYSPATPTVQGSSPITKNESLSTATIDNLFNISLKGNIQYLEETPTQSTPQIPAQKLPTKPIPVLDGDQQNIQYLKKGKKPLR
ncbi:Mediator of RNA polymerase II transcription subunit 6 [Wickerhamomyces ciferrii]|uniref:Mediator of RNA polymerase II transcription subunit 6 n=1 Tax=Wickerhamomyces ciferrii (strain ATCC 14091 / BCRC 22168 / CBS 111 / JCM 3599 / NBRC 0793 / NRRL Y-1031 F-60-10) TaxID=1206466 RepID=K0KRJ6_WICCF|nr:Mediator of RNA polymerase II transcription subunit 6 [Wickerhamomyces ciferrii]CCH43948.1 Mediator of RNA polymerase II transcription subunit 6 [Wickerhamomyces ciferrii]